MADLSKELQTVDDIFGKVSTMLPAAIAAYKTLWGIFKTAHPDATFADFDAALLSDSLDVEATSAAWLTSHGYQKDANGNWAKVV